MGMPTGRNSGLAETQDFFGALSSRRDQENCTEMAFSCGGFIFLYCVCEITRADEGWVVAREKRRQLGPALASLYWTLQGLFRFLPLCMTQ